MFTAANTDNEVFTFYIGDETKVVVEEKEQATHSIFNRIYSNFFTILDQTINLLEKEKNEDENDICSNNIFAFIGDRGTGKTSCMKSVTKMLENSSDILSQKKTFEVLESTDPSFFDEDQNILNIFIGRLFSRFQKEVKKKGASNIKERNEVIASFEEVKDALAHMNSGKICEENNLDQLMNLCAVVELRPSIRKLVDNYLDYVGKDFLIIPVDDIDLHTKFAYEMAEEIRKYLSQKRTIILMALKPSQLADVVKNHYLAHYKNMLDKKMLDDEAISDMASKYMIKLIPQAHRFPLKSIQEIVNAPVKIIDRRKNTEIDFKEPNLKNILTSLIFRKTRYLIYHPDYSLSPIIPSTLRECRQLLELLYRMPDYDERADGLYNKKRFKEYFFGEWALNNCSNEDSIRLKIFNQYPSADTFNKFVVQILRNKYKDFFEQSSERLNREYAQVPSEIRNILNRNCSAKNISLGDVLAVIHFVGKKTYYISDDNFILGVKFIYSLRLYEFYNKLVDDAKYSNESLSEYHITVGGNFFNNNDEYYMPMPSNQRRLFNKRVDIRLIDIKKLRDDIESNDIPLSVAELFALIINREYLADNDDAYRNRNKAYYSGSIPLNINYVWCNLFSIFYNITDVERCYKRVSLDLWNKAERDKKSLYNRIKKKCDRKSKNAFLSCSCIRNMDILDLLSATLGRSFNGEEQNFKQIVRNFFNQIAFFEKETYDKNLEGGNFKIDFKFSDPICQDLNDVAFVNSFEKVYNCIPKQNLERIKIVEEKINKTFNDFVNSLNTLKVIDIINAKKENKNEKLLSSLFDDGYKARRIECFNIAISNAIETLCQNKIFNPRSDVANKIKELFKNIDPVNKDDFNERMNDLEFWLNTVPVIE